MNTYKAFYNQRQMSVKASTSYAAQQKAATLWGLRTKHRHKVSVIITTKGNQPIVHNPARL